MSFCESWEMMENNMEKYMEKVESMGFELGTKG